MHDKISGREHFTWPQTQQRERGWCVFFIVFMNDLPQYHHPWFLSNSGFCFTFSISPDVLCSCVSKENRCIIIISSHPQYLLRGEASCRCTDRHIDVCKTMMTKCCRLRNGHLQWNHFHRYNLLAYTSSGTCLTLHRQNTSLFAIRNRGFSTQVWCFLKWAFACSGMPGKAAVLSFWSTGVLDSKWLSVPICSMVPSDAFYPMSLF